MYRRPIIVGREEPDTTRYGRLLTEGGAVAAIAGKGVTGPGLINAGYYIFNPGQLNSISCRRSVFTGKRLFAKGGYQRAFRYLMLRRVNLSTLA